MVWCDVVLCGVLKNYLPEEAGATEATGTTAASAAGTAGTAGTGSCPGRTGLLCERARTTARTNKLNILTLASALRNCSTKFNIKDLYRQTPLKLELKDLNVPAITGTGK